ncbi:MAG: pyridoxamine 5'-phosphate oxidase family protein [Actinomycetota bacterium]|nr:pyridoxamine 5'-phosphate oxidase family protein [Actinomycetota bacterium]
MTYTKETESAAGSFRELSAQECYGLLGTTTVGRVAFVGIAGQQLLPINFQYLDEVVYFQTSAESVLAEMADGLHDVAFSVDYREELLQKGWSVVILGSTSLVEDESRIQQVRAIARLRPWAPGDRSLVIALTPQRISGRRVSKH